MGDETEVGREVVYPFSTGLDVHKKSIVACVRCIKPGGEIQKVVRTFGMVTAEFLALSDWLAREASPVPRVGS